MQLPQSKQVNTNKFLKDLMLMEMAKLVCKIILNDQGSTIRLKSEAYFNATDRNGDGVMTEEEYVENRTITDEAKEIFNRMDKDGDGVLTEKEFVDNSNIADKDLAGQIFKELDTLDGEQLSLPRYLRVWGNWARED